MARNFDCLLVRSCVNFSLRGEGPATNVISFVTQKKGGTGESTLTVNLAVTADKAGEKVCIIDLDPQGTAAEAAIDALHAALDEKARGEAWRTVQKDEKVAVELGAFRAAMAQRFGNESVREMLRAEGRAGAVTFPFVGPEERPVLDQVAHLTVTLRSAERAGVAAAQREAENGKGNGGGYACRMNARSSIMDNVGKVVRLRVPQSKCPPCRGWPRAYGQAGSGWPA